MKPWYLSKTIWVNVLAIIGVFLIGSALGWNPEIQITILGVANIGLRFVTNQGITLKITTATAKR
jgi:UPF0716 family protein affecting phage T7 exclusion